MSCVLTVLGISIEWLGWEGTLKAVLFQTPAMGRDTFLLKQEFWNLIWRRSLKENAGQVQQTSSICCKGDASWRLFDGVVEKKTSWKASSMCELKTCPFLCTAFSRVDLLGQTLSSDPTIRLSSQCSPTAVHLLPLLESPWGMVFVLEERCSCNLNFVCLQ